MRTIVIALVVLAVLISYATAFTCGGYTPDDPLACYGNGNCTAQNTCDCKDDYIGLECEYPVCFGIQSSAADCTCEGSCDSFYCEPNGNNLCSDKGKCVAANTCDCVAGYAGDECQHFACDGIAYVEDTVCSGNGVCGSIDNCTCEPGWNGTNCEIPSCFGVFPDDINTCSGHGDCVGFNNCTCESGYAGENCSEPVCFGFRSSDSLSCYGNGKCVDINTCECFEGYSNVECHLPICANITSENDNCNCTTPDCEQYECYPANGTELCGGIGACVAKDKCDCEDMMDGNQCQYSPCDNVKYFDPNVCSGQGNCTTNGVCDCDAGFVGSNCSSLAAASSEPLLESSNIPLLSESSYVSLTSESGVASISMSHPVVSTSNFPEVTSSSGALSESSHMTSSSGMASSSSMTSTSSMASTSSPLASSSSNQLSESGEATQSGEVSVLQSEPLASSSGVGIIWMINVQVKFKQNMTTAITLAYWSASNNIAAVSDIRYTVSSVTHGRFIRLSAPGTAITEFTHVEVSDEAIAFVHDGSTSTPSFTLDVNDGVRTRRATGSQVSLSLVTKPTISKLNITVKKGQSLTLTSDNLSSSDSTSPASSIVYTITSVNHGRFERKNNPGVAITTFTQEDINNGDVVFAHDNSESQATFSLSVSNSEGLSSEEQGEVPIQETTRTPSKKTGAIIGGVLGGVFGLLLIILIIAAIILLVALVVTKKKKQNDSTPREMELKNV